MRAEAILRECAIVLAIAIAWLVVMKPLVDGEDEAKRRARNMYKLRFWAIVLSVEAVLLSLEFPSSFVSGPMPILIAAFILVAGVFAIGRRSTVT